jgi:hypothetical protein
MVRMMPLASTMRILWFSASLMNSSTVPPAPSVAAVVATVLAYMPVGPLSLAAVAAPPSPVLPAAPVPTHVLITDEFRFTHRMGLLPLSVI